MFLLSFHSDLLVDLFLDKLSQQGPDTISYKEHKFCQMGVAASYLKVSYNP